MESRPCGACTLCCRLIGIDERNDGGETDFPFYKPAGTNCEHCLPGRGCEIFGTVRLPSLCRTYTCLWKDPDDLMPESWRPDKVNAICHLAGVVEGLPVIRVIVDRNAPVNPQISRWVDMCVAKGIGAFVIQTGDRFAVVSAPAFSVPIENRLREIIHTGEQYL